MPQLTIEQQRAVALASARLRLKQAAPPPEPSQAAPKPEPLPTRAYPMSLGEAFKTTAQFGLPGLVGRTAGAPPSVMSELMMERLRGIPEAITGIPAMLRSLAPALAPIARTLMGGMGRGPAQLEDIQKIGELGKGVAEGVVAPISATARGGAALLAPETFDAPSDEELRREARAQGALLGGAVLGRAGAPVASKVSKYVREAPVRKGLTTISPKTLQPELPINAIKADIGVKLPKLEPGAIIDFDSPVNNAAKALGGETSLELGDTLKRAFNEAFPDLIAAQQQNPFLRQAIDSPRKFRAAVQWARNKVWRDSMAPAFKEAGEVDLTPVADQLISEIPESIRIKTPQRALALEKTFSRMFDGKTVKAEALHEFAKEARARIQSKLAKNAFDRQAAFGTPDGKMAESYNTALRDRLYQHVLEKTKTDLRPIAERYGALSELEQTALGLAEPKSFLEKLFTSYTFPTKRAVAARVGESLGQHMISDMKLLNRAFKEYSEVFARSPAERAKVTQPFRVIQRAPSAIPKQ